MILSSVRVGTYLASDGKKGIYDDRGLREELGTTTYGKITDI